MREDREKYFREWESISMKIAFSKMKIKLSRLTDKEISEVKKSLSVYALARQAALENPITTGLYKESLLGHRNIKDDLNSALKIIDSYSIDVSDIPFIFPTLPAFQESEQSASRL